MRHGLHGVHAQLAGAVHRFHARAAGKEGCHGEVRTEREGVALDVHGRHVVSKAQLAPVELVVSCAELDGCCGVAGVTHPRAHHVGVDLVLTCVYQAVSNGNGSGMRRNLRESAFGVAGIEPKGVGNSGELQQGSEVRHAYSFVALGAGLRLHRRLCSRALAGALFGKGIAVPIGGVVYSIEAARGGDQGRGVQDTLVHLDVCDGLLQTVHAPKAPAASIVPGAGSLTAQLWRIAQPAAALGQRQIAQEAAVGAQTCIYVGKGPWGGVAPSSIQRARAI